MTNLTFKNTLLAVYLFFFTLHVFSQDQKMTREQYILKYKGLAIDEMKRTGIPASIILAQALHESENGNSTLATLANNHFGIKCTSDWKGMSFNKDDDQKNECFRKYSTCEESFFDHSEFLKRDRYKKLFNLEHTDYKGWAKGLKEAGYATNPKYPEVLVKIIEENQLYRYDQDTEYSAQSRTLRSPEKNIKPAETETYTISIEKRKVFTLNGVEYIIAREGDTFEKLSSELDMWQWQLPKYNDMSKSDRIYKGQVIYLQPKRRNAETGNQFHIVKEGESMWLISQLYGIKLNKLYLKNNLKPGTDPQPGQKLLLRD